VNAFFVPLKNKIIIFLRMLLNHNNMCRFSAVVRSRLRPRSMKYGEKGVFFGSGDLNARIKGTGFARAGSKGAPGEDFEGFRSVV
jgi:hypothetical protein